MGLATTVHSTNHVAVFVGHLRGILYQSAFSDTIGREKSRFGLPRFSAKLGLLECH